MFGGGGGGAAAAVAAAFDSFDLEEAGSFDLLVDLSCEIENGNEIVRRSALE